MIGVGREAGGRAEKHCFIIQKDTVLGSVHTLSIHIINMLCIYSSRYVICEFIFHICLLNKVSHLIVCVIVCHVYVLSLYLFIHYIHYSMSCVRTVIVFVCYM